MNNIFSTATDLLYESTGLFDRTMEGWVDSNISLRLIISLFLFAQIWISVSFAFLAKVYWQQFHTVRYSVDGKTYTSAYLPSK